jgi:hypothetical protein
VLPVLTGLLVLIAVASLAALPSGHSGSLADWLRAATAVVVLSLGGRLVLDGSVGVGKVYGEAAAALHVIPMLVTVVVLGLAARAATRAERRAPSSSPRQLLVRSCLTGALAGAGLGLGALLARTSESFGANLSSVTPFGGSSLRVGPGPIGAFVGALLLIGLASAAGRAIAFGPALTTMPWLARYRLAERIAEFGLLLRTLRTFAAGLLGAAALALLLVVLHELLLSGDPAATRGRALAGLLVLGVNLLLAIALGSLGVPAGMTLHVPEGVTTLLRATRLTSSSPLPSSRTGTRAGGCGGRALSPP